jgi:hypothetical protein
MHKTDEVIKQVQQMVLRSERCDAQMAGGVVSFLSALAHAASIITNHQVKMLAACLPAKATSPITNHQ